MEFHNTVCSLGSGLSSLYNYKYTLNLLRELNYILLLVDTLHFANDSGEDQASIGVPPHAVKTNPNGAL